MAVEMVFFDSVRTATVAISLGSLLFFGQATSILAQPSPKQILASAVALSKTGKLDNAADGAFCDNLTDALKSQPAAIDAMMPEILQSLRDPDQAVVGLGLQATMGIEMTGPRGADLVNSLKTDLVRIISSGSTPNRVFLLAMISDFLQARADEDLVAAIRSLVDARPKDQRILGAAAFAMLATRPTNEDAEAKAVSLMDDPSVEKNTRLNLIQSVGLTFYPGTRISEYILLQSQISTDKEFRDAATEAVTRYEKWLDQMSSKLVHIVTDPQTSESDRSVAQHWLNARDLFRSIAR